MLEAMVVCGKQWVMLLGAGAGAGASSGDWWSAVVMSAVMVVVMGPAISFVVESELESEANLSLR